MGRWIALLGLAACNGGPDGTEPATTPPVTTPTPTDSTPTNVTDTGSGGTVQVQIVSGGDGSGLVGVDVLVSDADGHEVGLFPTDDQGEVEVDVPDGGSVSYAETTFQGYTQITSSLDLVPGDSVRIWSYRFPSGTTSTGAGYPFSVFGKADGLSADRYAFVTRCETTTLDYAGPAVIDNSQCPAFDTDEAVVVALDPDDRILRWGAKFGFDVTGDPNVVVPLTETDVDSLDLTLASVPSGFSEGAAGLGGLDPDWRTFDADHRWDATTSPDAHLEIPALSTFDRYSVSAWAEQPDGQAYIQWEWVTDHLPAQHAFDGTAIGRVSVDAVLTDDPARPEVRWARTSGPAGDAAVAGIGWSMGSQYRGWSVTFDPAAHHSAQLPELPAEWSAYGSAGATGFGASVSVTDVDWADGYGEWLASVNAPPDLYDQVGYTAYSP